MTSTRRENEWRVYVNGLFDPSYQVMTVSQVVNGKALPTATFKREYEKTLNNSGARTLSIHENLDVRSLFPTNHPTRIDITRKRADGIEVVEHVGYVVGANLQMAGTQEETTYTSRFDHHFFSATWHPIAAGYYANYRLPAYLVATHSFEFPNMTGLVPADPIHQDVFFNPLIDGVIRKNLAAEIYDTNKERPWPFDIDGVPTAWLDDANIPAELNVDYWTLADAVQYLLQVYNFGEPYVVNPIRDTLIGSLGLDPSLVRNFKVRRGDYLPQVLDKLLVPLGYNWKYVYGAVGAKPTLRFWQRDLDANTIDLKLQNFGDTVNIDWTAGNRTEVAAYNINYDAFSRSAGSVLSHGDFQEFEVTVELVPGWNPIHDNVDVKQLQENSPEMQADPTLARVHRDWVLNEGGDYCDWAGVSDRPSGSVYFDGLNNPFDFSAIFFGHWLYQRRKFDKMLTIPKFDPKSSPFGFAGGIQVEIWDPRPSMQKWVAPSTVGITSFQKLQDECGIRFGAGSDGTFPWVKQLFKPAETDPANSMRVRVTATIRSDIRLEVASTPALTLSPVKALFIDAGRKYVSSRVDLTSIYNGDPNFVSRALNSFNDLQDLTNQVLEQWNAATVSGTINLIDTQVAQDFLGLHVRRIESRNTTITATPNNLQYEPETPFEINPMVVAQKYDVPGNNTTLSLEILRRDLRSI